MITINLGVDVVTYPGEDGKTTADVGEELENDYGIVEFYVEHHWDDIAKNVGLVIADKFYETDDKTPVAMANIEQDFVTMLDMQEMDGRIGIPTAQSLIDGRPSFIDTGLYSDSFRSWVDK